MRNVSGDLLGLVAEIATRRMPMVLGKRAKRLGGKLGFSQQQERLLLNARNLHHRFVLGRYEASDDEIDRVIEAAKLLVACHVENIGGDDGSTALRLTFDRAKLLAKDGMAKGTYLQLVEAVHDGRLDAVPE